jgi:hypothetical protein
MDLASQLPWVGVIPTLFKLCLLTFLLPGQRYLGDPLFEPVWAELNKLGSVIFIHPADTVMPPHLNIGPCKLAKFEHVEHD